MKKNRKAFTLIELLIVISLIAILVGVILVITSASRQKSVNSSFVQNVRSAQGSLATICNADVNSSAVVSVNTIGFNSADVEAVGSPSCAGITVKPAAGGKYASATPNCFANGVTLTMTSGVANADSSDCKK